LRGRARPNLNGDNKQCHSYLERMALPACFRPAGADSGRRHASVLQKMPPHADIRWRRGKRS
jgi:hypothetical protein